MVTLGSNAEPVFCRIWDVKVPVVNLLELIHDPSRMESVLVLEAHGLSQKSDFIRMNFDDAMSAEEKPLRIE